MKASDLQEFEQRLERLLVRSRATGKPVSERIEQSIWRKVLLDFKEVASFNGRRYPLKWKSIGCGIIEFSLDPRHFS